MYTTYNDSKNQLLPNHPPNESRYVQSPVVLMNKKSGRGYDKAYRYGKASEGSKKKKKTSSSSA